MERIPKTTPRRLPRRIPNRGNRRRNRQTYKKTNSHYFSGEKTLWIYNMDLQYRLQLYFLVP